MDLREKPGKIQKTLELFLRFRLISFLLFVILAVFFLATHWGAMITFPVAASESLGIWLAEHGSVLSIWQDGRFYIVSGFAMLALLFVFGSIRGGIASLLGVFLFGGALLILGGAENMVLLFWSIFAIFSLVLLLFAKWSVACVLFPFAITWVLLTGIISIIPTSYPVYEIWFIFSVVGLSIVLSFSLATGKYLAEGVPQSGALIYSAKKLLLPSIISSLLFIVAFCIDVNKDVLNFSHFLEGFVLWILFNVWFYIFLFPLISFAPWERLRSKERRVKIKEKKNKVK